MTQKDMEGYFKQLLHRIDLTVNPRDKILMISEVREWIQWVIHNHPSHTRIALAFSDELDAKYAELSSESKRYIGSTYFLRVLIFLIIIGAIIFIAYMNRGLLVQSGTDLKSVSSHTIPFRASLASSNNIPIDEKTDVIFRLYSNQLSETALYTGSCSGESGIAPDYSGEFSVVLGSDCGMDPIPSELFDQNSILYLGVTVADASEIRPRYQLPTSVYSRNAALLDSKPLGTSIDSIPYVNESNEIVLDDADPVLNSTNGLFRIKGLSLSLESTGVDAGDILIQPGNFANTLIPVGNVGIGTFTPKSKLSVLAQAPASSISTFVNLSDEDTAGLGVLSLGLGIPEGSNSEFISFYTNSTQDDLGDKVGSIGINKGSVTFETSAADFAEYFSAVEDIPAGFLVGISPNGVRRAQWGDPLVGVTSDSAGFVGNSKSTRDQTSLVGLVGQVSLLISNENGEIARGDTVGLSSVNGVGMKGGSNQIGYALSTTEELSEDRFSNILCPKDSRKSKDNKGRSIKCGFIIIMIQIR